MRCPFVSSFACECLHRLICPHLAWFLWRQISKKVDLSTMFLTSESDPNCLWSFRINLEVFNWLWIFRFDCINKWLKLVEWIWGTPIMNIRRHKMDNIRDKREFYHFLIECKKVELEIGGSQVRLSGYIHSSGSSIARWPFYCLRYVS